MQDRVEPPILLSRVMTFVFASAIVVLVALVFTLYNMFPLNRPQVFFLMTAPKQNLQVVLREMVPSDENLENYKKSFILEYIKARNEIVPNAGVMRTKWNNGTDGVVYTWSTQDVYNTFTETNMWQAWMSGLPDFEFSCSVEFGANAFEPYADAILAEFGVSTKAMLDMAAGVSVPKGRLPVQLPRDMETVEKHREDVAFDLEAYIDEEGNCYDYGFGLDFQGEKLS